MLVERGALAADALDQFDRECARALVGGKVREQGRRMRACGIAAEIDLVERLQRQLAAQMSESHKTRSGDQLQFGEQMAELFLLGAR